MNVNLRKRFASTFMFVVYIPLTAASVLRREDLKISTRSLPTLTSLQIKHPPEEKLKEVLLGAFSIFAF